MNLTSKLLNKFSITCSSALALAVLTGCQSGKTGYDLVLPDPEPADIKSPPREFRAAWVATVANIDWPSDSTLTTEEQQAEAIAILDQCEKLNMNAVIFQGRPAADAMYASEIEPWSFYLTNEMGTPPDPYYDPLEFWIDESHKRGIELHVWFNPYRALHPNQTNRGGELSEDSVVLTRPDLSRKLTNPDNGSVFYWMDPAHPDTRQISTDVVMDVVNRYNVDGIHFDDYFYPYPNYNGGEDFPDDDLWEAYQAEGGDLNRGDWRRKAVNDFVENLYGEIKAAKPHVKFGISPFGIFRPGYPESIQGFDQYEVLYADARLWLQEGWVDYYTPQLYWAISKTPQSYPVLLNWWHENNTLKRNLWPGTFNRRPAEEEMSLELVNQIHINRALLKDTSGITFFSMKGLMNDENPIVSDLMNGPFSREALVPSSPWLDDTAPAAPSANVAVDGNDVTVTLKAPADEDHFLFVVYTERGGSWDYNIVPGSEKTLDMQSGGTRTVTKTTNQGLDTETSEVAVDQISRIAVSSVDRTGNESARFILNVN